MLMMMIERQNNLKKIALRFMPVSVFVCAQNVRLMASDSVGVCVNVGALCCVPVRVADVCVCACVFACSLELTTTSGIILPKREKARKDIFSLLGGLRVGARQRSD